MSIVKPSTAFKAGADWISAEVRAYMKDQVAIHVDTVADLRDSDMEQARFVYIKSKAALYRLNLSSGAADDGDTAIHDNLSRRYLKITGTGPGGAFWDVAVDALADRDAYDAEAANFAVFVADTGSGRAALYVKNSATSADWSDPLYFTAAPGDVGVAITAAPAKTTPVDADAIGIIDSADSNALKKVTWANLKATLYTAPALTGTPTAPTASGGTNTTQIATTAFVQAAIDALLSGAPGALDTLNELAAALGDDAAFATTVTNALALKAPLASPALTGTPTAPTAAVGTATTQLATTAFVQAAMGLTVNIQDTAGIAAAIYPMTDRHRGARTYDRLVAKRRLGTGSIVFHIAVNGVPATASITVTDDLVSLTGLAIAVADGDEVSTVVESGDATVIHLAVEMVGG